jgi:hypothetical protein
MGRGSEIVTTNQLHQSLLGCCRCYLSIDWSEIEARVSRMTQTPEHLVLDDNLLQWSPPAVSDSSDAESDDDSVKDLEVFI